MLYSYFLRNIVYEYYCFIIFRSLISEIRNGKYEDMEGKILWLEIIFFVLYIFVVIYEFLSVL